MNRPLFAYGTLRDPELLAAVLGHAVAPVDRVAAAAPGYRAVPYPRRAYPALVAAPGRSAPGLLVHGLSDFDWSVLDGFEGDEYERRSILVLSGGVAADADVYWPARHIATDAPDWQFDDWMANIKPHALVGDGAAAAELRARLTAAAGGPGREAGKR